MIRRVEVVLIATVVCIVRIIPLVHAQSTGKCDVTLIQVPESNVAGGVERFNVSNALNCESECARNTSCQGFDWNRNDGKCFLLLSTTDPINYNSAPGVDHYNLMKGTNNCLGSCSYPSWVPLINSHAFGGTAQPATTSLNECASLCIQDASCTAFDWDPRNAKGSRCWIVKASPVQVANASGVYNYAKNCSPVTGGGFVSTTTVPGAFTPATRVTTSGPASTSGHTTASSTPLPSSSASSTRYSSSSVSHSSVSTSTTTATTKYSTSMPRMPDTNSSSTRSSASTPNNTTSPSRVPGITSGNNATSDWNITIPNGASNSTTLTSTRSTKIWPTDDAANQGQQYEFEIVPLVIKPTYVVLAGLGGGCILLVLIAVVILCQYPINSSDSSVNNSFYVDTMGSSDNIIDMNDIGQFDERNSQFLDSGVVATEFEPTNFN